MAVENRHPKWNPGKWNQGLRPSILPDPIPKCTQKKEETPHFDPVALHDRRQPGRAVRSMHAMRRHGGHGVDGRRPRGAPIEAHGTPSAEPGALLGTHARRARRRVKRRGGRWK